MLFLKPSKRWYAFETKALGLPSGALSKWISILDWAAGAVVKRLFSRVFKIGNKQPGLSKDLPCAYRCPGCHGDSEPGGGRREKVWAVEQHIGVMRTIRIHDRHTSEQDQTGTALQCGQTV